jgi:DNA modification methylase
VKPVFLSPGIGDNRPTATLYYGQDVRETLRSLPDASVHTVCTSPPYFGLRDYGKEEQIGLEDSPEEYIQSLVEVFREVKRVLRPDGTLWLNLGDSYNAGGRVSHGTRVGFKQLSNRASSQGLDSNRPNAPDLKQKDLIGIPWRVAIALQGEGWYLRQDIIWAKPNPMPESVTDRCTKSHEYLFMLAHPDSGGRYFYDSESIREESRTGSWDSMPAIGGKKHQDNSYHGGDRYSGNSPSNDGLRNRRSVWSIPTRPYVGAHFATWPPELVRPMVLAGSSERGVCSNCGSSWKREVFSETPEDPKQVSTGGDPTRQDGGYRVKDPSSGGGNVLARVRRASNTWKPTCECKGAGCIPATVLDPFSGSGTTGMVALQEGRNYIGIDINEEYLPLAMNRVQELPAPVKQYELLEEDVLILFGN